jgi:hypothetical protein
MGVTLFKILKREKKTRRTGLFSLFEAGRNVNPRTRNEIPLDSVLWSLMTTPPTPKAGEHGRRPPMEDARHLMEEVVEYLSQRFPSDQEPSPHARLVLFALAAYKTRSDHPPGFPHLDHLERVTQLSRPTLRRHMKQWEARGVLKTWHAHWGHERFDAYLLFPSAFRISQACGAIPDPVVWQTTLRDSPHDLRCGSCRGDVRRDDLGQVKIALPFQNRSYRVFAYLHASCVSTPGKPDWGVVWRLEDFLQPPGYALDEMEELYAYVREKWLPSGCAPTPA